MIDSVKELVEALRAELQHYGELLALLEADPSDLTRPPGVPAVVNAVATLQRHGAALGTARQQRLQAQARFASTVDCPPGDSLHSLLPNVPVDYRPLLRALEDEVVDLQARLRERARLSHDCLHTAADQLEGLIESVVASPVTPCLNA